jgi:hypothetical protein
VTEDPDEEARASTRDFILEWTRAGADRSRNDMDTLDDKATKVFSASGVVIGLAGLASFDTSQPSWQVATPLIAALVAFAAVAALTIEQLKPQKYRGYEHAQHLWELYGDFPVDTVKNKLVTEMPEVFEQNDGAVQKKAQRLRRLLYAASAEILLVGVAVIARLLQ